MLKYANFDIVFQEVPDEVTLAINITNCPNQCPGCHSKYLWDNVGKELDMNELEGLVSQYKSGITCVCFMGGDAEPKEVADLARQLKTSHSNLKMAWYSILGTLLGVDMKFGRKFVTNLMAILS